MELGGTGRAMIKVLLLAVFACAGCEVPPEAKAPEPSRPALPPPSGVVAANLRAEAGAAPAGSGVQVVVSEANGVDPAAVGKIYGSASEALAHCHQPGGGTVHVRIVRKGASLQMNIEPGATLDPQAHRCVLEALSTVDLPDTAGNVGGPTVPPTGFTSLITLSW